MQAAGARDFCWTLPAAGLLAAPLLWPALYGVGGAVQTLWDGQALAGGGTLWPGERVQGLLAQGGLLAALAALLATAIGGLCAWSLLLAQPRAQRLALVALLAASFCFGTVVHLLAWRALWPGVSGGVAGWAMAVVTLALRYAPLSVALLASGLATLERAELETALCIGGGAALWAVARRRLLRLAGMSVAAVGALVFCESELPPLLGVHVYAEEFLSQVALEPSASVAAAMGWPLMVVALACAALLAGLPRLRATAAGAVSLGWMGQWAHPPALLQALLPRLVLGLAALPLALLAWGSVQATGRWPAYAGAALFNSVWVAGLSALLACLWAWALASGAVRAGGWVVPALNALLWVMLLWPSALTGIALAGWAAPDWVGAATPLILAHALRLLPFAAWLLLALRDVQPRSPGEQLQLLGAGAWSSIGPGGWAAFRHVQLPAAWPGLIAAFMLCVGLSLAELTATVLTVPPGMETVILRLYNLLHYGDQRGVMMLALVQGLAVALCTAAAMGMGMGMLGGRRAGD
jgi:iron(III) transport system permease protein